jgi:hypothetical protein
MERAGVAAIAALMIAAAIEVGQPAAAAALDEPLALGNRQPLVQLHGLPAARSGEVLAAGASHWRLGLEVANNFTRSQHGGEVIELDGESRRFELGGRWGWGHGWEFGVQLPLIQHEGGGLDGFIEGWHDFWGLPDGDRPDYPRDRLRYRYQRDGRTLLDFHDGESGVGDLQLSAAYTLASGGAGDLALAATVNLPTGDAGKLTGAEATSVALTLAGSRDLWRGLAAHANAGVLWLERGAVLGSQQEERVWFGSAGLSWAVAERWRLKAQLEAHTAFYDSGLDELGGDSLQLVLGGSVRLSRRWLLDLAVSEDIAVDTAPDVVFQLALRRWN